VNAAEWFDLALGSLQLVLALVVLKHLRRFGRAFPWLAALMLLFSLRAAERLWSAFSDTRQEVFGVAGDALLVAVLLLLILGLRNTVRGLELALSEADARAQEYARALHDYRTLARHRLATPLTVIRAAVRTMRDLEPTPAERDEILEAMERATFELEHVALEPSVRRPEERALRPLPTHDGPAPAR
jgi:signal transduction histidine kinase